MNIDGVKEWLEETIAQIESNPDDTTPERIRDNRIKLGGVFRRKEEIESSVIANKPKAKNEVAELKQLLYDYYHYFDAGYKPESGETIDTLPTKILTRMKWLRENMDSL